jgi:hypothetical protein
MIMTNEPRPCPCGSGQDSVWILDARGIPLCRACTQCRSARLSSFRPEVLTDPDYECDEQVEED